MTNEYFKQQVIPKQPVRYCFFMTGNEPWFKLAMSLHEQGFATPVLWLGDDRHYANARRAFGDAVVRMLDFVHRPNDIPSVAYRGEFSDFFFSVDYIDAKDICLKMMDRLDLNGTFSRIDREAYFHKLTIWALKFFDGVKPDALLMIEKPHSHAQYLLFRVAKYLKIPTAHFKDCPLFPVNFLQLSDGSYVKKNRMMEDELATAFEKKIDAYVDKIHTLSNTRESFQPHYMAAQHKNSKVLSKIVRFMRGGFRPLLRDAASDLKLYFSGKYQPTNPYKVSFISRLITRHRRIVNLRKASEHEAEEAMPPGKFVYFPLHYEPERTTNPDGEAFHDQFKALVALRHFLPADIAIVVKEHPSQLFFFTERGSRGRSPLFYALMKELHGVRYIGTARDSIDLIRGCEAVATITGSVALEAALMGKRAIVFGKAWYEGCPNTFLWETLGGYDELCATELESPSSIAAFLKSLVANYGIPMINNGGGLNYYRKEWYSDKFLQCQHKEMTSLITIFFAQYCVKS